MALLANAGIYVALDVNTSKYSLNREYEEAIRRSYNEVYLQSVFSTIDAFAKYDNTLLFFAGNEVITANETWAGPYIKAVIRDMKAYIKARNYRAIPVGYSATDLPDTPKQIADYIDCGSPSLRGDFMAFNDYSWCGPNQFSASSWATKVKKFKDYGLPLL
jgi:1,3-beta-glucanosyltransferase GAS5